MENKNILNMTNEGTNELKNDTLVIRERNVTISLARYEELIRAEQKLVLLCRIIHQSDAYEAKQYRIIAGEELLPLTKREIKDLEEEEACKQKKGE